MTQTRILVVEDEVIVARDICLQLTELGYGVVGTCARGEEALELTEKLAPDLVLMDIQLAGAMDGIAAALIIRTRFGRPVVFLTAFAETETLSRAKQAEPFGYVIKPFDDRELRTVVEMAMFKHGAEARLRASEERYRLLVENTAFPVVVTNLATGRVVFANQRAEEFFGFPAGTAVGTNAVERWCDLVKREEIVRRIRAGGQVERMEVEMLTAGNVRRWVEISVTAITFEGEPAGFSVLNDITQRRAAELALRARERELELFFSQSIVGFLVMTLDQPLEWRGAADQEAMLDRIFAEERTTRVNDALLEQYGATREQIIGRTPAQFMADDLDLGREVWRQMFDEGQLQMEIKMLRLDGTPFWIEASYHSLTDAAGRITGHFGVQRDITERKHTESELVRSQARLMQAMEFGRMGGWEYSRAEDAFTFNDQIYALYGTTTTREGGEVLAAEVVSREFIVAEDAGLFAALMGRLRTDATLGAVWQAEHRIRRRDGEIRHIDMRVALTSDAAGTVVGARGVNIDVTERVRAEVEARKLARAVEQSPVTVVITDPSGNIEYVNPQFTKLTGYTLAEARGQNPRVLKSGVQLAAVYQEMWATISAGREWHGEMCNRRKDGTLFWEDASISPIFDAAGHITQYLAVKEDITVRRESMARLSEQAALLNVTRDAIIVVELGGRVQFWNRAAEQIYGWTSAEAMGQALFSLVYDATHPAPLKVWEVLLTDGEWSGELRQCAKSGATIEARCQGVVMRDAAGSPRSLLLTASDITESKRQEAVFLRAQRMDSIGSLTSGVAHDLNNVLSPIMMSVELLRPLAVRPEDREVIRLLSDSVRRGADVVRQLLLFGRGSEGPGETIEISTVFKEIIRMMRETFPRNLTIGGQISRDVWTVRGYPTQIYQILLNLCVNARDAMPTGGTLNVDACNRHLDAAAVRLQPGAKPGRYVELTVTDTGTGIPAEIVDKIFDPFFTTKERGQGSGLGLSTVLGIAKGFGGFVNVTSRVGAGSEFKVFLPASGDLGEATAETKTEAWRGHGETVLVVDDEEGIRMVVARLLIASGYRVLEAANGGNALILARAHRADLRAVVLDMMMPGLDGLQVVAALREFAPDLPIVACSGLDRYRDELVKQGFTRVCFLTKPILADSLRQALRALLDGKPDPFAAANLPTL